MAKKDYIGLVFNRLTIKEELNPSSGMRKVSAVCECGNYGIYFLKNIKSGHTSSCGCLHIRRITKHGESTRYIRSREYNSWAKMNSRCNNHNDDAYLNYGGRGIVVCVEWSDFSKFKYDMGERPPNCTLDRIDVNGNYNKENCRWASKHVQVNNTRKNIYIEHLGLKLTASEWSRKLSISVKRIYYRIYKNWPTNMILSVSKFDRKRKRLD